MVRDQIVLVFGTLLVRCQLSLYIYVCVAHPKDVAYEAVKFSAHYESCCPITMRHCPTDIVLSSHSWSVITPSLRCRTLDLSSFTVPPQSRMHKSYYIDDIWYRICYHIVKETVYGPSRMSSMLHCIIVKRTYQHYWRHQCHTSASTCSLMQCCRHSDSVVIMIAVYYR